MKKIINITLLSIGFIMINSGCFAQRTVSLRAFETLKNNYRSGLDRTDDGENITYIKDVANELDKFVGIWKGSFNNRNYEISFVKRVAYKFGFVDEKSSDLLIGLVTVKDNAGTVIYTNTNKDEKLNGFHGDNFQSGTNNYRMDFTGKCYNDSGNAFLYINPTTGKMQLTYRIISDVKSDDCASGFVPILPTNDEGIILTKQP